jgi:hypothetical protein
VLRKLPLDWQQIRDTWMVAASVLAGVAFFVTQADDVVGHALSISHSYVKKLIG